MLNQYIETMPKILFFKDNELIAHLETTGVYYANALYYTSDSATQLLKQSDHIGIVPPGYTNILILDTPTTLEVNTSY